MRLEREAQRAGGYVHALIGNHEVMNVEGDLRYAVPGEFAAFADRQSARRRDAYYERFVAAIRAQPPATGLPTFDAAYRAQFDTEHPLGWVEHRAAWATTGTLRTLDCGAQRDRAHQRQPLHARRHRPAIRGVRRRHAKQRHARSIQGRRRGRTDRRTCSAMTARFGIAAWRKTTKRPKRRTSRPCSPDTACGMLCSGTPSVRRR